VTAATRLTVGLRYTSDHKDVDGYGYNADGSIRPGDSVTANPEPSKTWEEPTYTLIVDHDFNDHAMGYASYSHGYQSGSYNISSSVSDGPVDPQIIDAYEIGLKSSTADNRLRVNTSVFYYEIRDLLVSQNIDNTRITANAAEAEYKGVDLDVVYAPIDNLTLTLGAAYTDPKYSDYQDATFYQPNPNGNGTFIATVGDATGNQIAYSEKLSGTISASYVLPTSVGEFSFNGSLNHHDGAHYDAQGLLVQPDYQVVNASLRWVAADSPWHVELWSNNLTNEKYATFFANTPVMYMNPSPPRTYGVSIGYHWR
jgi:iron complex outermembrane receptor protein